MPYWSVFCFYGRGHIVDALLECIPGARRSEAGYQLLWHAKPGAALACPYCGSLLGFDDQGSPHAAQSGWPVFRYGLAELEAKKLADGEPAATPLAEWALRHRFTRPGTHPPFAGYLYAEQAPANEAVP